jgi:hypothetical protein
VTTSVLGSPEWQRRPVPTAYARGRDEKDVGGQRAEQVVVAEQTLDAQHALRRDVDVVSREQVRA